MLQQRPHDSTSPNEPCLDNIEWRADQRGSQAANQAANDVVRKPFLLASYIPCYAFGMIVHCDASTIDDCGSLHAGQHPAKESTVAFLLGNLSDCVPCTLLDIASKRSEKTASGKSVPSRRIPCTGAALPGASSDHPLAGAPSPHPSDTRLTGPCRL